MTAVAFPKPRRAPREPQRLKRKTPLRAKRWGVSRGPSKTKHARRERGLGRMAFLASLPCGVHEAFFRAIDWPSGGMALVADDATPGPCRGRVQVMHLGWKADPGGRRKPGDVDTAPGCERHHAESGTKLGGLGRWYVALGRDGQRAFRAELVASATRAWEALSDEHRAAWDELADIQRKTAAEARRRG